MLILTRYSNKLTQYCGVSICQPGVMSYRLQQMAVFPQSVSSVMVEAGERTVSTSFQDLRTVAFKAHRLIRCVLNNMLYLQASH